MNSSNCIYLHEDIGNVEIKKRYFRFFPSVRLSLIVCKYLKYATSNYFTIWNLSNVQYINFKDIIIYLKNILTFEYRQNSLIPLSMVVGVSDTTAICHGIVTFVTDRELYFT